MSSKQAHLVKWAAGVASSVVAGVILFLLSQPRGLLNQGSSSEKDTRTIWKEGTLAIPVSWMGCRPGWRLTKTEP